MNNNNNNNDNTLPTIMKIMDLFIKNMKNSRELQLDGSPMVEKLVKKGFRPKDIETAVRCLGVMAAQAGPTPEQTPLEDGEMRTTGIRQLHASEAIRLTADAQRVILALLEGGQISPMHFEQTIDYIWKHDLREVSPTRLQLILYLNDPTPNRNNSPFMSERVEKPRFIN